MEQAGSLMFFTKSQLTLEVKRPVSNARARAHTHTHTHTLTNCTILLNYLYTLNKKRSIADFLKTTRLLKKGAK